MPHESPPTAIKPIAQSPYTRESAPGFLERTGVQYYRRLAAARSRPTGSVTRLDDLPPDTVLQTRTRNTAVGAALLAAGFGMASSAVPVWFELRYFHQIDAGAYYSAWLAITLSCTLLEFVALFWLSLQAVHRIAAITGHRPEEDDPYLPGDDAVPNLLARAALELPDPVVRYLGVDPLKQISRPRLLLVGVLYKAKVVLTSVAAKFILQRLGGKFVSRVGLAWVSVPVTALWNAIVMYRVAQEARLRLYGHRLAYYLVEEVMTDDFIRRLSPAAREGAIRAISTMLVMTQSHHPNMLMLLYQFSRDLAVHDQNNYDDWPVFLAVLQSVSPGERGFLLDLLCIAAAFDGHLSRLERRQLPQAFGAQSADYLARIRRLRDHLLAGRIHAAQQECPLDVVPG